jgi:coproporphyrinogen III oxidase
VGVAVIKKQSIDLEVVKRYLLELQDNICNGIADADGKVSFEEDAWEREGGGGGRTRVLTDWNNRGQTTVFLLV